MCNLPDNSKYFKGLEVIGYSSKLFRDDVKALEIDEGRHLISWVGDESLKMDRFDVRGLLNDFPEYEPSFEELSPEEKEIEDLCNNERYRALSLDETRIEELKEEDIKRREQCSKTGQIYNQVSFSYSEPNPISKTELNSNTREERDEPFTPSMCSIAVPPNIQLPKSKIQNQIIEKTAQFTVSNGAQMEILIKTRQANNEKFKFLNSNDELNPYYKLVLESCKSGSIRDNSKSAIVLEEQPQNLKFSSLIKVQSAPKVETNLHVQEQTENVCSYKKLVNNIHKFEQSKDDHD